MDRTADVAVDDTVSFEDFMLRQEVLEGIASLGCGAA